MKKNRQIATGHPLLRVRALVFATVGTLRAVARRRFTVMLIPHSTKPARSARVNLVTLLFLASLGITVVAGFIYLATSVGPTSESAQQNANKLDGLEASLDTAREQIGQLTGVLSEFERAVAALLGSQEMMDGQLAPGSLSELLGVSREGDSEDSMDRSLREAIETLRSVRGPLGSLTDAIVLQRQVVSDLPMLWPIINGLGQATMEFGPNIHPIGDIWYMHKGIDIAYIYGTPVVATGNGVVADAGFDTVSGYGGYVEIAHPYGFSTKYAHLENVRVSAGDTIRQGDTIGLLGSSGLATGPNVHYEVTVGTEVIDPAPLLKIDRPDFRRRVRSRS